MAWIRKATIFLLTFSLLVGHLPSPVLACTTCIPPEENNSTFPFDYHFEDYHEYLINVEKSSEAPTNLNYNFLVRLYSELNNDQKLKFSKNLQSHNTMNFKTG